MIILIQEFEYPLESVQRDLVRQVVGDELCSWFPQRINTHGAIHTADHRRFVRIVGRTEGPVAVNAPLVTHVHPRHDDRLEDDTSIQGKVGAVE